MNARTRIAIVQLALLVLGCFPALAQSVTITPAPTDEEFVGPLPGWRNLQTHYGAVGDGVADDTAALTTALGELRVARNNGWSTLFIPAGTYRITSTVVARKVAHEDFIGTQVVGADPATTTIRYDGPPDQPMIVFDGWYSKMSRFTLDGNDRRASVGLQRDGTFSTYCEISDVHFRDLAGGVAFGGYEMDGGQAETLVVRCRFTRCGTGVATGNFNSLDIWVWWCVFEDCVRGIHNFAGNYHAIGNLFLRSTEWDVGANNSFNFVVIDNVSIGAEQFSRIPFGNLLLLRNRIYEPRDAIAVSTANFTLAVDNVVKSGAVPSYFQSSGLTLAVGNQFTVPFGLRPYDSVSDGRPQYSPAPLIDNNPATTTDRFDPVYLSTVGATVDYRFAGDVPKTATAYSVRIAGSGNPPRLDPLDLKLFASTNQGRTWTLLDARTNVVWAARGQRQVFTIATPGAYGAYRFLFVRSGENGTYFRLAELELLDANGNDLTDDGLGFITGDAKSVDRIIDEQTVAATSMPTPTSVAMPLTPPNFNRAIFSVARGTGDDALALQNAINAAVAAGNRAVVHLRAGAPYQLARTVVVPANANIQIIGDGAGREISRLVFNGAGVALRLDGPSRATLRDFVIEGGSPLLITNADQPGGRVYAEQVTSAAGNRPGAGAKAYYFNGIEESDVTLIASGSGSVYGAAVAVGGPKRAAGLAADGQLSLVTGTYEGLQTHAEVLRGARLTTMALYSESALRHFLDLTGSGDLNVICNVDHSVADEFIPTFSLDGFKGRLAYLGNLTGRNTVSAPTDWFRLSGDGASMKALIALQDFGQSEGPRVVIDETAPPADFSFTLNDDGTENYTQRQVGLEPGDPFIRDQLALLRDMRLELPTARTSGVTDVKIFRVALTPSRGGTGLEVRAGVNPADTVPAGAPTLSAQIVAGNEVALQWSAVPGAVLYSLERRVLPDENSFSEIKLFEAARLAYRDVNVPANASVRYRIRAWSSAGFGPYSVEFNGTTPRRFTLARKMNAAGPAVGDFARESALEGVPQDDLNRTTSVIDLSGVINAAPVAVYQTARWSQTGDFNYTIGGFAPGEQVRVRLHFAEIEFTHVGARVFNVFVNGATKLASFDILAAAGAPFRAVVRELEGNADANGQVVVRLAAVNYSGAINGLEVGSVPGPSAPSATRTHATATVVRLDWTDNSTNETGFKIERKTGDAGAWSQIGTAGANQTSYEDRAVAADTFYSYRVRATNAAGDSNASAEAPANTRAGSGLGNGASYRLLDGLSPVSGKLTDNAAYELGMEFRSTAPGAITHIRYWRAPSETGTHIGRIWSLGGAVLASVTFTGETASGWQQQALAVPLSIAANTSYIVTVNCNTHYVASNNGLLASITNGPLFTVANGSNGRYGPPNQLPTQSYENSNYFRDVVFTGNLPSAPTNFNTARNSATSATLTWTDNAATEDGYLIERSTDGGATWQGADLAAANATSLTLTNLAPGYAHRFRLTATSPVGASPSVTTDFAASLTPLQSWRYTWFGTASNTGPAADLATPTGDGIANLLKYGLGLNPLVAASSEDMLRLQRIGFLSERTFTRLRDAIDITYGIERSPDLAPQSWQEIWSSRDHPYPNAAASVTESIVHDESLVGRAFYRLRITQP